MLADTIPRTLRPSMASRSDVAQFDRYVLRVAIGSAAMNSLAMGRLLALVLGERHATEPDHSAGIPTLCALA
jgi:hypothetical protein